ncbi:hypothetical protein REPUB_Repub03eG0156100 [Reevesia pubescens]
MTHYNNKLRELKVEVGDQFLVWQILESVPSQFDNMKLSYKTWKKMWDLNIMTAIVVQEEEMLRVNKSSHSAFMVTKGRASGKKKVYKGGPIKIFTSLFKKKKYDKSSSQFGSTIAFGCQKFGSKKSEEFKEECHLCRKYGHKMADCQKCS